MMKKKLNLIIKEDFLMILFGEQQQQHTRLKVLCRKMEGVYLFGIPIPKFPVK